MFTVSDQIDVVRHNPLASFPLNGVTPAYGTLMRPGPGPSDTGATQIVELS